MPSPASDEAAASATVAAAAVAEGMAVAARVEEATGGDGSAAVLGGVMAACRTAPGVEAPPTQGTPLSLEVLEVDILWPRWVARIGVTQATEACFLTPDRQCMELPLLRLPRLVPEVVGCDPCVPRDLARVGWRGAGQGSPTRQGGV